MIYAIVLAAGKGTRMKTELPKCAFPLMKKPMISYILDNLKKSKVEKNIIVLGHKKEIFNDLLDESEVVFQDEQLGTAHAVKMALPVLEGGISVILPGDAPLINESIINQLINEHISQKNQLTVGAMDIADPFGYGRLIMEKKQLVRIVEEKEANETEKKVTLVNTGLMVVDNKILKEAISQVKNNNLKKEYYLTDIVNFIEKVGISIINDCDSLIGINDLYTLSTVEEYLHNKINKELMLSGVNIINPSTVYISPDAMIEPSVVIYPGTIITGKSIVKKGAVVGPNSELHNATLMENAVCKHSVIYDSTISKNATVGPFSHMRMNAVVGENNRIGNFVEIKKSILGANTNAAHLTYMGDAIIGSHVNMGCGVITVNYDGKNKNKTVIGDNVFVGCNSNLIAPVTVGNGAYIAAGSTINKDVPEDALAIARQLQTTKENYAKKYKK